MPIPPPSHDIEASLLGLAAILERAVAEVNRVIEDVKNESPRDPTDAGSDTKAGIDDR